MFHVLYVVCAFAVICVFGVVYGVMLCECL